MDTIAEICTDAVAFSYRSIDRLVLNAYIPTLQTPAAMAVFFREVQRKPILAGKVFKELTDRFVSQVMGFAKKDGIPVLRPTGRTRPGEVAQKALKAAANANRWGVVAIVVHQELARVFASYHAGGRATNYRVKEDRRLVNHYYFYVRDRAYGDGFVRISSYPPFQTRIWMNAHGYLAAQLRRRRVAFHAEENCIVEVSKPSVLQEIADRFDAGLVEQIARKWTAMVPDPLTPEERAAGYPTKLSVYQAEFCDNLVFHRTQVLNRMYEQLLRDHLHLGRLDMVKVMFDRRITKKTPSRFQTRVLRQGVVSCLKVFYKKSFLKQYNKGGRVLRTEVCINDPGDFGVRKSLVHLGYLGTIAHHALRRFSKAQAVAMSTALDRSTFERIVMPSETGGKRVAGIRFGAPGAMRVLEALGCAGLTVRAFSNADLRRVLFERLGTPAAQVSPGHIGYQLRKLRGKGLVRKVQGRNLYTLTDLGYRVAIYFTKLHQRLLAPALDTFDTSVPETWGASAHSLDRALQAVNAKLDALAQLCQVEVAA
jgi:DNA-binding PadR family transcriptional regulator